MRLWFPALAVLVACKAPVPDFLGENMEDYFPFAENTDCRWEWDNEDTLVPYRLVGTMSNYEQVGDHRQYTIEYVKDCIGNDPSCTEEDFVRSMTWSVQGNQGIHLHHAETPDGEIVYDPSSASSTAT